jgi:hypothetical protein
MATSACLALGAMTAAFGSAAAVASPMTSGALVASGFSSVASISSLNLIFFALSLEFSPWEKI